MDLEKISKRSRQDMVKKFYPSVEECKVNNLIKCTEEGCQNVFTSESNLTLHIAKTHNKPHLIESDASVKQYYCPELRCIHHKDKFFKSMKFLRQHYLKVHSKKDYQCSLCQKSFPSENILKNHREYCGICFECCDCQASYSSYETLKTHGRRKKHNVLLKSEYKSKITASKSDEVVTASNKSRLIVPKQCISLLVFPNNANKAMTNQESQTEDDRPKLRSKMTQVNRDVMVAPQNTQQTQTGSKYTQFTVETQTIGDFLNVNNKNIADILNDGCNLKSSITQTDIVESRSTSCNTSFNLEDFDFTVKPDVAKTSLGTQTYCGEASNLYSSSTTTHDSIHTDTSDLLVETLNDNITNEINNFEFYNCNTETQTDFILDDEMFNCDYYMSNMYTQTCDILNDLGFSDIQTQTVLDDVLRSVESQTLMSHAKKNSVIYKDTSHMETQTDMEFRQMLEVINS